jgi:hypothetical protein
LTKTIPEAGPISCEKCGKVYQIEDERYSDDYLNHIRECHSAIVVDQATLEQILTIYNERMDSLVELASEIKLEDEYTLNQYKEKERLHRQQEQDERIRDMQEREELKRREEQIAKEREQRRAEARENELRIRQNSITYRLLRFVGFN